MRRCRQGSDTVFARIGNDVPPEGTHSKAFDNAVPTLVESSVGVAEVMRHFIADAAVRRGRMTFCLMNWAAIPVRVKLYGPIVSGMAGNSLASAIVRPRRPR